MMNKKLHYISIFCISLGASLICLSFFNTDLLKADLTPEDLKKIEQSKFINNFKVNTYTDLINSAKKLTDACSNQVDASDRLIDKFNQKSQNEIDCLLNAKEILERSKNEKEITQILKEYKMLDSYFQRITTNMEEILKQSKQTTKARGEYTS